jgi:hypothetical protein
VATVSSLVDRVRLELGDIGQSFVQTFVADGTTNRFRLHYSPLDSSSVFVYQDGNDVTSTSYVEESTGVLVVQGLPADGVQFLVTGTYYRYFTQAEMTRLVNDAVDQHSAGHTDSVGRKLTMATLPSVEEYPVAIYATAIALYTLATDASFDIDIQAPDGVSIPRSERYRQLMDMVAARKAQYAELCTLLGIGLYRIEVYTFKRQSKATGRYVPVYKPQEVDDRSYPQRVHTDLPTYGDKPPVWATDGGELLAYQNRAFNQTVTFTGDYDDSCSFVAKILNQRGSVLVVENFGLSVDGPTDGTYTATLTLTPNQTMAMAGRTYWSIQLIDPDHTDPNTGSILPNEIIGGNFWTERISEVIV